MTDVLTTILTVPAATPVSDMTTPVSPRAMFRTVRPAPVATDRNIIKLNPILVTDLWTAALWVAKPEQRPACREQPRCMTIVRPVPTWENTPPARVAQFVSMKNVRGCGTPPVARRIVRIIVTSAAGSS